jgi:hypothetical protein
MVVATVLVFGSITDNVLESRYRGLRGPGFSRGTALGKPTAQREISRERRRANARNKFTTIHFMSFGNKELHFPAR